MTQVTFSVLRHLSHLSVSLVMKMLSKTTLEPKKVLLNRVFDVLEYTAPRMLDFARKLVNNLRTLSAYFCVTLF